MTAITGALVLPSTYKPDIFLQGEVRNRGKFIIHEKKNILYAWDEFYTQRSSQLGTSKHEKPTVCPPHPPVNKIQSMWTGECCEHTASQANPETASRWRTYVFAYLVLHPYLIFKNLIIM